MLRATIFLATALTLSAPAHAYDNPVSRGLADFLNIFSEQPIPRQVVPWNGKQAAGTVVI